MECVPQLRNKNGFCEKQNILRFVPGKIRRTLVVMNISSRLIIPSSIFARTAFPTSTSFPYKKAVSMCRYPASIASLTARSASPDDD